jgi:exodeoxyribonuclease VII small subunit
MPAGLRRFEERPMAKKLTFEEALKALEEIVAKIESGQVPLEKSIEMYAEGIALVKQCRAILDSAEGKIQLLAKGEGESLEPAGALSEPADGPGEDRKE